MLCCRDAEDGTAVITRAGFQFLLLSTAKQVLDSEITIFKLFYGKLCVLCGVYGIYLFKVWLFLQHYLHTAEKRSLSAAECLAFLYQLSFSTLGKVLT